MRPATNTRYERLPLLSKAPAITAPGIPRTTLRLGGESVLQGAHTRSGPRAEVPAPPPQTIPFGAKEKFDRASLRRLLICAGGGLSRAGSGSITRWCVGGVGSVRCVRAGAHAYLGPRPAVRRAGHMMVIG